MVATTLDAAREIRVTYTGREKQKVSEYIDSTNTVSVDQLWFWTEEWQAGERQVDEYIKAGNFETFNSMEDFLDSLGD